jgi:hypothetical protein
MQRLLFDYPGLDALAGSVFDLKFDHSDHEGVKISGVALGKYISEVTRAR